MLSFWPILLYVISVSGGNIKYNNSNLLRNDVKIKEWWQSTIFYQIYPRSFMDSNGDGIGDIKGIISKLDYLQETGITATWLSPILKSPQADFGYDISDFKMVDPIFGTNEDLEKLFEEANKRGIKIIMDFVPNHTSDEHEWFQKSKLNDTKYKDYYVWHGGKPNPEGGRPLEPNNWQAVFHTRAWTWDEGRKQYYLHQFHRKQPDLNYRNPEVKKEMENVLRYWLEKGASGFRVDAINHMFEIADFRDEPLTGWTNDPTNYGYTHHIYTKDLDETYEVVREWREMIEEFNKKNGGDPRILMTEAYTSLEDTLRYYETADGRPIANFPFNFILIENLNENSNANDFKNQIDKWLNKMPDNGTANWVLGNHDKPRYGSRYGTNRIDSMLTLLMTLPGISVTYNGDEIGMVDYRDISWEETMDPQACNTNPNDYKWNSRDPQRTPFQWDDTKNAGFSTADKTWLPMHPNYEKNNLKLQKEAKKSHYKYYQQLAKLRQNDIFTNGDFRSRVLNDNVLSYYRSLNNENIFGVLISFSNEDVEVNLNELYRKFEGDVKIVLATSTSNYEIGNVLPGKNFKIKGYDAVIFENVVTPTTTTTTTGSPESTQPITTTTETSTLGATSVVTSLWLLMILSVVTLFIN